MENKKELSDEQELAEDLLTITTHFSAKFHGRRKYKVEQNNVFEEVKIQH
jgi:predicted site-specific integrase-resolvase